jgi:HSP20 family protein
MKELTKRLGTSFLQDFYPAEWQTKMFDEFFNRSKGGQYDWSPPTDIKETSEEYIIEMEIPGMEEDDIKVSINENHLTIIGEIKKENSSTSDMPEKLLLVERFTGSFQRTFTLPSNRIDSIGSKAKFKNGILRITVTKAEEIRPREIKFES